MNFFLKAASAAVLAAALATGAAAQDKPRMGVVVKIGGIPWFNAMEVGIKEQGDKLGVDAFMIGPTSADPALQVRAIEDLIAQGRHRGGRPWHGEPRWHQHHRGQAGAHQCRYGWWPR